MEWYKATDKSWIGSSLVTSIPNLMSFTSELHGWLIWSGVIQAYFVDTYPVLPSLAFTQVALVKREYF